MIFFCPYLHIAEQQWRRRGWGYTLRIRGVHAKCAICIDGKLAFVLLYYFSLVELAEQYRLFFQRQNFRDRGPEFACTNKLTIAGTESKCRVSRTITIARPRQLREYTLNFANNIGCKWICLLHLYATVCGQHIHIHSQKFEVSPLGSRRSRQVHRAQQTLAHFKL